MSEIFAQFLRLFTDLDTLLQEFVRDYGVWTYGILFAIVFCETGLVVLPLLPGDSLLFGMGALAAIGELDVRIVALIIFVAPPCFLRRAVAIIIFFMPSQSSSSSLHQALKLPCAVMRSSFIVPLCALTLFCLSSFSNPLYLTPCVLWHQIDPPIASWPA